MKTRFNAWRKFHADNPKIFQLFAKFATEAKAAGRKQLGARLIGERIRWFTQIETISDGYKLNDHHWPYYSRLLMIAYPSFDGFFRVKNSRFDATDDEIRAVYAIAA